MRRVAVFGCGGAGKTTLARELGERLGVPVIHADFVLFRDGQFLRPPEEWEPELEALVDGDAWVIDTIEPTTIERSLARVETAIFVDLPRRSCFAGLLRRRLVYHGHADPERGVIDRIDLEVVRWIWRFRRTERPQILEFLSRCEATTEVVVLNSRREVRRYLDTLPPRPPVSGVS